MLEPKHLIINEYMSANCCSVVQNETVFAMAVLVAFNSSHKTSTSNWRFYYIVDVISIWR